MIGRCLVAKLSEWVFVECFVSLSEQWWGNLCQRGKSVITVMVCSGLENSRKKPVKFNGFFDILLQFLKRQYHTTSLMEVVLFLSSIS